MPGPGHRDLNRRWITGGALADVWRSPAPRRLDADLEQLGANLVDPFDT